MQSADKKAYLETLLKRAAPITPHHFAWHGHAINFDALRLDQLGHYVSGNKILKLGPELLTYLTEAGEGIPVATFGGARSHSLQAFSALARILRLNAMAFIRQSPTGAHERLVTRMQRRGVRVVELSPEAYKFRENEMFIDKLLADYGEIFLIPEGASTPNAVNNIAVSLRKRLQNYQHVFVSVGMGGTMAGCIKAVHNKDIHVHGISSVKADPSLPQRVRTLLNETGVHNETCGWDIDYDFAGKGYGKISPELEDFKEAFETQTNITLDTTYTTKSAYAMWSQMKENDFKTVLWLQTLNAH